ncbi:MAG: type II secretion system F family protein [Candidatus Bathyarchaeia archaeon]
MPKIEKKTKKITVAVSVAIAFAIVFSGFLNVNGYFTIGIAITLDDYVFFGFLTAITPIAILDYLDYRWRKAVNERLPDLFRNIVQAQEVGMTLPNALEAAAKRDYGPLSAELKRMTVQISWGATFEDALLAFGRRVGTVLTQRTVPMIIEASRAGGHVEKVFEPMGKFIQTINLMEKERRAQTRPYIAIIYVALFVFLFTIVLLFRTFFTNGEGVPLLSSPTMAPAEMQRIFMHLSLIQGFFGGLVAGKMGEGTISAGLKHSLVMMLASFVALKFFL